MILKIGKFNVTVIKLNSPSPQAIENTTRKVNEIMNKRK